MDDREQTEDRACPQRQKPRNKEEDMPTGPRDRPWIRSYTRTRLELAGSEMLKPELRIYFSSLSLDPNTANRKLKLSNNNKTVTCVEEDQSYPDHQDRFDPLPQILCSSGLTGRCYWEVKWSAHVHISVCYRGIKRKGLRADCRFGDNDQSWSLVCSEGRFFVGHKNNLTFLRHSPSSSSGTVAVYLDCEAGSLSFYSVSSSSSSERLILLHTFNTTFTEPLFPGFKLSLNSSVTLLD